jgi:hypothetical protein
LERSAVKNLRLPTNPKLSKVGLGAPGKVYSGASRFGDDLSHEFSNIQALLNIFKSFFRRLYFAAAISVIALKRSSRIIAHELAIFGIKESLPLPSLALFTTIPPS